MQFKLLCMDTDRSVTAQSVDSLKLAFQANDTLWSKGIEQQDGKIEYTDKSLTVAFSEYDTSGFAVSDRSTPAYDITIESNDYVVIEPLRMKIIDHLRSMQFSYVRILHDDISEDISCRLYPYMYKIENKLREFILNTLVKKIGINFWEFVVPKEDRDKAKNHKSNEPFFIKSGKIVADVSLLYFDALGKIVYQDVPIFTQPKDILEKVEQATSIDELKKELLGGNFQKYFKTCFEQKDFQDKWRRLNELRNKVAHSSYFVDGELKEGIQIVEELNNIIDDAYEKVDTLQLSVVDRQAIKKAIDTETTANADEVITGDLAQPCQDITDEQPTQRNAQKSNLKILDKETLFERLREVAQQKSFVGIRYFVKEILGKEGFAYGSSYTLINMLIDEGALETEKRGSLWSEYDTTAIKIAPSVS